MMWSLLVLVGPAHAQEFDLLLEAPAAFTLEEPKGIVKVERVGVPMGERARVDERYCRVRFLRTAATISHELLDCVDYLVEPTERAVERWVLGWQGAEGQGELPTAGEEEPVPLFEVWYRYGMSERERVQTFVRTSWRYDTVLPEGVESVRVLPLSVDVTYPADALDSEASDAACDVTLDVSFRGYPAAPEVSGCPEPFATAVSDAAKQWRFRDPMLGGEAAASRVTLGVVFEAVPSSTPGELEGSVRIEMPSGSEGKEMTNRTPRAAARAPLPAGEPLFVLDHGPYAEVQVYGWVWPEVEAAPTERRCSVLFQTNSARRVMVWPEACEPELQDAVLLAAQQWSLKPGTIEPGERYGRFRGEFVFPPEQDPFLRVPQGDVVSLGKDARERVRTYQAAKTRLRVPPKIPEGVSGKEECAVAVTVSAKGKPVVIEPESCSEGLFAAAEKAVKQWRWDPAMEDGEALESATTVKLKFSGG